MEKVRVIATVINDIAYDQRMIRICTSLQSFGYDVTLVGRYKKNTPQSIQNFKQIRLRMRVNSGPLFYLFYNLRLFGLLLIKRFDVVHAVDLDTLLAAFCAAKIKGKKIVYDAHEYFTEVPELIDHPVKKKIWLSLEKFLIPGVPLAITVGSEIAKEFESRYATRFEVIRNCPMPYKLDKMQKPDLSPYILYQGALNKGRGLELLIEAAADLPLDVVIAGSGDLDATLKLKVKEHKLENKVHFLGLLEPEKLRSITAHAVIGYNLSENLGLSYYYSLNNKYFDYIHAGIPAITNAFPEYLALNEKYETGVFVNFVKEELIESVKLLLDDKELYDKLKKNCFLAAQDLNWVNEEKKLKGVYASIS